MSWIRTIQAKGARRAGSPADHWFEGWAVDTFKSWGMSDVRIQKLEVPYWKTGESFIKANKETIACFPMAAGDWKAVVKGGLYVYSGDSDLARLKGKIVLLDYPLAMTRPGLSARRAHYVHDLDNELMESSAPTGIRRFPRPCRTLPAYRWCSLRHGGPPPHGDSWPFQVMGIPTVQFAWIPVYLLDQQDTLDNVDQKGLVEVSKVFIRLIEATRGRSAGEVRARSDHTKDRLAPRMARFDRDGDGVLQTEERLELMNFIAGRQ